MQLVWNEMSIMGRRPSASAVTAISWLVVQLAYCTERNPRMQGNASRGHSSDPASLLYRNNPLRAPNYWCSHVAGAACRAHTHLSSFTDQANSSLCLPLCFPPQLCLTRPWDTAKLNSHHKALLHRHRRCFCLTQHCEWLQSTPYLAHLCSSSLVAPALYHAMVSQKSVFRSFNMGCH